MTLHHALCAQWHPDKNPDEGAKDMFQKIQTAYAMCKEELGPDAGSAGGDAAPGATYDENDDGESWGDGGGGEGGGSKGMSKKQKKQAKREAFQKMQWERMQREKEQREEEKRSAKEFEEFMQKRNEEHKKLERARLDAIKVRAANDRKRNAGATRKAPTPPAGAANAAAGFKGGTSSASSTAQGDGWLYAWMDECEVRRGAPRVSSRTIFPQTVWRLVLPIAPTSSACCCPAAAS